MDLLDDPSSSPDVAPSSAPVPAGKSAADPAAPVASTPQSSTASRELPMRRFRKVLILVGAALMALILSVRHRGDDLQLEAHAPLRAAVRQAAAYDLSQVQIITKTLFYVRENYFDKSRFDHKRMLVGGLDFLQRDVPEIIIDRYPERDPKQVKVRVGGQEHTFDIETVDSPWSMRGKLQEIFKFVQPNLRSEE